MSHPPRTPGDADHDLAATLVLVERLQPALRQRDRAGLADAIGRLVALRAALGDQWRALADLAADCGEVSLARAAIDLFVEASGGDPRALYSKAALLERCGALREAYELIRTLPQDVPDPAGHAYSRGTSALFVGELDDARARLEQATRLQPLAGAAWLSLAMAVDLAREPEIAERIVAAQSAIGSAPAAQRAPYFYALGRVHAARGEHAAAFAAFARGAQEMKALAPYDRAADRARAAQSLDGYSADRIAAIGARQDEDTGRAIFVTATPRSGTTLVEQILTAHSAVGAGGEIDRLQLLAREVRGLSFPALEAYVARRGTDEAARLWRHWLAERCPAPGRVVDKTLSTTRHIGLAAALLPGAPLIWLTRDPLDRAWSCFSTFFPATMPWSYDLEDIAAFFHLEDALLARWRELLGERLLVVPYEELARDPAPWIGRILAHCGLPEEPGPFAPHENERTVATASVMQVRRPIATSAIGSAAPYRQFLAPFTDAYFG